MTETRQYPQARRVTARARRCTRRRRLVLGGTITQRRRSRGAGTFLHGAILALTTAAALAAGSLGRAEAAAAPDPGRAAESTVHLTYRGHEFTVPAGWDVVDLEKNPDACVRFDRPAVYLGTAGSRLDCPAKAFGRAEALHVRPAPAGPAAAQARVTENRAARSYEATARGIAVTASYGGDRELIRRVLRSASLPVDTAREGTAVRPLAAAAALPADATSFQGKGFDRCAAPASAQMDTWKQSSPYGAVGVYIGGVNAGCGVTVDAAWMRAQYDKGWRYFPIYVGPQASRDAGSCDEDCAVITDPVPEGAASARDAVAQANALGLPAGSVLYYNMEAYASPTHTGKVLPFVRSWTATLHELGYRSGVYGSRDSLIIDLVGADESYLQPDVIDFAAWDGNATTQDPKIPDTMWANHQRIKQYAGDIRETHGGLTLDIDANLLDVGEGVVQPPAKKDTALAWSGPASVSNGSPAALAATLTEKDGGAPVAGRKVGLTLGSGAGAQSCEGTTDAAGRASCTVPSVNQPLNADATVPAAARFAGDDAYKESEATATVRLQYVSGRAFGLQADVPLLGLPVRVGPTPDTGQVRTAGAESRAPACANGINALVLSAQTLCARVDTRTGPSAATSTASVEEARIGLPGLPVVALSGVKATSTASCTAATGRTELTLTVAGTPVEVGDLPNVNVDLGLGARLVVNEQVRTAGGLTVNAVHLTAPGGIDVVVASATAAAHNCA
ncbi:choice-of-anchor P family protein [Streptomyces tritici]|uniref:choice-of-anchor P family protein n=1 Tax=Streptomyces tritici TaxID=2054410 RepID=UPI003AF0C999